MDDLVKRRGLLLWGLYAVPFTMYTDEYRATSHHETRIIKYTLMTPRLLPILSPGKEPLYKDAVSHIFIDQCDNDDLKLNNTKTKEMCIDFRTHNTTITPIIIKGQPIEQVTTYKYLGP